MRPDTPQNTEGARPSNPTPNHSKPIRPREAPARARLGPRAALAGAAAAATVGSPPSALGGFSGGATRRTADPRLWMSGSASEFLQPPTARGRRSSAEGNLGGRGGPVPGGRSVVRRAVVTAHRPTHSLGRSVSIGGNWSEGRLGFPPPRAQPARRLAGHSTAVFTLDESESSSQTAQGVAGRAGIPGSKLARTVSSGGPSQLNASIVSEVEVSIEADADLDDLLQPDESNPNAWRRDINPFSRPSNPTPRHGLYRHREGSVVSASSRFNTPSMLSPEPSADLQVRPLPVLHVCCWPRSVLRPATRAALGPSCSTRPSRSSRQPPCAPC